MSPFSENLESTPTPTPTETYNFTSKTMMANASYKFVSRKKIQIFTRTQHELKICGWFPVGCSSSEQSASAFSQT